jgi:hypothetical protein
MKRIVTLLKLKKMKTIHTIGMTVLLGSVGAFASGKQDSGVHFEKQIWPIVRDTCIKCHGPNYLDSRGRTKKAKEELRLDSKEGILQGSEDGKVVRAGDASKSSFYKLLVLPGDDEDIMPPKGDPLTKPQTDLIKKWIDEGAKFGDWAAATEDELKKAFPKGYIKGT